MKHILRHIEDTGQLPMLVQKPPGQKSHGREHRRQRLLLAVENAHDNDINIGNIQPGGTIDRGFALQQAEN